MLADNFGDQIWKQLMLLNILENEEIQRSAVIIHHPPTHLGNLHLRSSLFKVLVGPRREKVFPVLGDVILN